MAKNNDTNGRWITIGGVEGEDGKRHGVSPVFVRNGRIEKGAPSLVGRQLSNLKGPAEDTSRRKENQQAREYDKAVWSKKARAEGIDPEHLHRLADELMEHDEAYVEERKRLLRDARETLRRKGYDPGFLTHHLRTGRIEDSVPFFDELTQEMQDRYPAQFNGHDDAENRLLSLLAEGNPEVVNPYSAYQHALDHLLELRDSGGEVSDEPLPEESGFDPLAWGGGFQDREPAASTHHTAKVQVAWDRYDNRHENAKGGGLFGGEDLQARRGFAQLPDGAPILFVEGQHAGHTGRVVRDEEHGNRVVAEIDGHPEWGLVPISPEAIEPLNANQSWRTDTATGDFKQGGLFGASAFLPNRGGDDDSVPFSRHPMNTAWDKLTPRELNARASRVMQYSRQMGADILDGNTFDRASDLDQMLSGRDPAAVDKQIEDGRQRVARGEPIDRVATSIAYKLSSAPNDPNGRPEVNRAKLLEKLVRTALTRNVSLAESVRHLDEQTADIPDAAERESIRHSRESEAMRFARSFGHPKPAEQDYGRKEINAAGVLMSRRQGLTFDRAIEIVRNGR